MCDLYAAIPWDEPIQIVTMRAAGFARVLEHSVASRQADPHVLQVSGITVRDAVEQHLREPQAIGGMHEGRLVFAWRTGRAGGGGASANSCAGENAMPSRFMLLCLAWIAAIAAGAWAVEVSGPSAEALTSRPPESSFAAVDRYALAAPADATRSVDALAAYLKEAGSGDMERARAVFRWIAGNVSYEARALRGGPRPDPAPAAVLRERRALCEGYAALFDALARGVGLESAVIPGFCRGVGYRVGDPYGRDNHAWNVVRIAGRWGLADSTWGSGYLDGDGRFVQQFQSFYFLPGPAELIYSHLPRDPRWELLAQPVGRDAHAALPCLLPDAWTVGVQPSSHASSTVETDGTLQLAFKAPRNVVVTAQLTGARRTVRGATFSQEEDGRPVVHVEVPAAGDYTLLVFAAQRGQKVQPEVMRYRVAARSGVASPRGFPRVFASFRTRGRPVPWQKLQPGTEIHVDGGAQINFKIKAKRLTVLDE